MQDEYYQTLNTPSDYPQHEPIDWLALARLFPWLMMWSAWALWVGFLLIPTDCGLHDTALFPLENNILCVLAGLELAIACTLALSMGHTVRSLLFVLPVLLLAVWF